MGTKIVLIIIAILIALTILGFILNYFIFKKNASDPAAEQKILLSAQNLFANKQYSEAARMYASLLKLYPKTSLADEALLSAGMAYFSAREYDSAIVYFQRLIDQFPKNEKTPQALYYVAIAYTRKDDNARAKEYLQTIIDNYPSAGQVLSDAQSLNTQISGPLIFNEAKLLFYNGDYEKAIEKYQEFLRDYPTGGSSIEQEAIFHIALSYSRLNDPIYYERALLYFQKIIDDYPQNYYVPDALYYAARVYQQRGETDKAEAYCAKILQEHADTRDWLLERAKQCFK